jgi:hypothetical protein
VAEKKKNFAFFSHFSVACGERERGERGEDNRERGDRIERKSIERGEREERLIH